jgi:hypothetical protein
MFLLSFNIKNPRALSSFLNRGPTWLMEYGVDDDTHIVQFPMRGSFPPYSESFTGIWSIWAIWSKLVGSARQLYYYWKCYQHLSPFHLSSPPPYRLFFFVSFFNLVHEKNPDVNVIFNVESIGSIFTVYKRMRGGHCVVDTAHVSTPPKKSRFPFSPWSLYCQK